ncbi:MAG: SPOR domain-containing protein [Saprospiraceae bacterium]
MSRLDLLTVAIVIVCLGALGYLVYKIVSLMNPPADTPAMSIEDTYEDAGATRDSTYTDWDDEASTSDDVDMDDDAFEAANAQVDAATTTNGTSSYSEEEMDDTAAEAPAATTPAAATRPAPATAYDSSGSTAAAGRYMVLAGSYKQRANADTQVARLKKLGFTDAKVELFDRGTYAVVLVNRFDNYGDAKRLVADLSAKGIEAIVDEKK